MELDELNITKAQGDKLSAIMFFSSTGDYVATIYVAKLLDIYASALTFLPFILDYVHKANAWDTLSLPVALNNALTNFTKELPANANLKCVIDTKRPAPEQLDKCLRVITVNAETEEVDMSNYIAAPNMETFEHTLVPAFHNLESRDVNAGVVQAETDMITIPFHELSNDAMSFISHQNELNKCDFIVLDFNNIQRVVQN